MKRTAILIVFACAVAMWASAQSDDSATKSKIVALEKLWNQAYKSGDTKALDSILDEGIVLVNDDGSVQTKAEFLASVKSAAPQTSAQQQQVFPGIFERSRLWNSGDCDRRHESERYRRRQVLYAARTLRRYVALQKRKLGLRRHRRYACSTLRTDPCRSPILRCF